MSNSHADFDEGAAKRSTAAPYNARHPIPTIQGYQGKKEERQHDSALSAPVEAKPKVSDVERGDNDRNLLEKTKDFIRPGNHEKEPPSNEHHPYKTQNRNIEQSASLEGPDYGDEQAKEHAAKDERDQEQHGQSKAESPLGDTSEAINSPLDPKQKRKYMKTFKRDHAPREVTDPVTHLPVTIHDSTKKELDAVSEYDLPLGSESRTTTEGSAASKDSSEPNREAREEQAQQRGIEKLFPPPSFDYAREEIVKVCSIAVMVGLGSVLIVSVLAFTVCHAFISTEAVSRSRSKAIISYASTVSFAFTLGGAIIWVLQGWLKNRVRSAWDDGVWTAEKIQEERTSDSEIPESTKWLNSILSCTFVESS